MRQPAAAVFIGPPPGLYGADINSAHALQRRAGRNIMTVLNFFKFFPVGTIVIFSNFSNKSVKY